jgi:primary-amine oxidase
MLKKVPLKKTHGIMLVVVVIALAGILLTVLDGQHLASAANSHPLDPLTAEELSTVTQTLAKENLVAATDLYSLITLEEPPKEDVLKWKPGDPVPRLAFAIVKKGPETFEAIVDTIRGKVLSWKQVEDVQTGLLPTVEWNLVQTIVRGNQEWQAAARKRGIENFREVICVPNTVGYFGSAEEEGRRLVKVVCYSSSGSNNYWGRPIEGLIAVVDLNARELVRLIDTGVVPVPTAPADFDQNSVGSLREPPNPISITQSEGPSFKVTGHLVDWQKWQFHFRMDPRVGPVVSVVRYNDNGNLRSILYEGSLSEMFIPYMDPDVGWYFRTFMDAGEEGMGRMAVALQPGLDCPPNAVFFDADFADDQGKPYTQANAACLFERYAGDIAWRHYDSVTGQNEVRRQTDLVLRSISSVGNYDYIFDWIFRQDGSIKIALGATGIPLVKAVGSRTLAEDQSGLDTAYGHQIAENTVAINHDHFISYRLDLDVDGQQNSFVYEPLTSERLDGQSLRKSIWVLDSRTAATEQDAKLQINIQHPALWRVINPNVIGPMGYPVSYQLEPEANAVSLLSPDDFPQQRAGFTDFNLWVTPYDPHERYAAGTYPNQSKGGDGLPAWTRANRPIQNTDLVLWYTLGFHHVVRAEDWPVLPTTWSEFEIRPFDFFQRNPALDIPASEGK